MADFFTWNNPNSLERVAIERFILEAGNRIDALEGTRTLPFKAVDARATLAWLRGLVDLKPSQIAQTQAQIVSGRAP